MRRWRANIGVLLLLLSAIGAGSAAHAVQPDEIMSDPVLEERARGLSAELRCLVCQNQSIDDSDAPLARDLRLLVRERLKAGDTDAEVREFVVDRYGEFVLLRPPFSFETLLLWFMPLLTLVAAFFILRSSFRSVAEEGVASSGAPAQPGLTTEEQAELDALLARKGEPGETRPSSH